MSQGQASGLIPLWASDGSSGKEKKEFLPPSWGPGLKRESTGSGLRGPSGRSGTLRAGEEAGATNSGWLAWPSPSCMAHGGDRAEPDTAPEHPGYPPLHPAQEPAACSPSPAARLNVHPPAPTDALLSEPATSRSAGHQGTPSSLTETEHAVARVAAPQAQCTQR